jgi:hypothetical protein
MKDEKTPNPASEKEQAEGSRENVNVPLSPENDAVNPMERGHGQVSDPDKPVDEEADTDQSAGGITNRPLEEEIAEQGELPRRGRARDEGSDER